MINGFKVINPGILTLIQDTGRFGFHGIGLTNGGPLDPLAFRWATRLCGAAVENAASSDTALEISAASSDTALEISIGGLSLEAYVDTVIAVTGADIPLTINGQPCQLWQSHSVKAGDYIELGYAQQGCRSYLAVSGGFDISHSFGSAATVSRESIGGLSGEPLQQNEYCPVPVITQRNIMLLLIMIGHSTAMH